MWPPTSPAKAQHGFAPGLAVVLVGEDPASKVYVRNKAEQTVEVRHAVVRAQAAPRRREAGAARPRRRLNADPAVHGILVQLPLPKHIDSTKVLELDRPAKDVDGFHPVNVGRSRSASARWRPARPSARSSLRSR